jgi:3-oxoacyl-[acyl-carrier protein] reductase
MLAINLSSTFFCSQEAPKNMATWKESLTVNAASASAKIDGAAVGSNCSASKAGNICLTWSIAIYAAPFGIRLNCVCPGPTETRMTDEREWREKINSYFTGRIPLKLCPTTEEMAYTICFLLLKKPDTTREKSLT